MSIEYVRIAQRDLDDFRALILPNIWDELTLIEDMDETGLYAVGAVEDSRPVAALIAQLCPDDEVCLHSIVVEEPLRRRGIGRGLVEAALQPALEAFSGFDDEEPVRMYLHAGYALPQTEYAGFNAFLQAVGFSDFSELPPVYRFEAGALRREPRIADAFSDSPLTGVRSFMNTAGEAAADLADFLESAGIDTEPELCFFTGEEDTPDCMVLATYGSDEDFYAVSRMLRRNIAPDACLPAIKALLRALAAESPDFILFADGSTNEPEPLWAELAKTCGEVCPRAEAAMYLEFT